MYKNPHPGKFIVFEGLDRTTQAGMFYDHLRRSNRPVILTKEPTGAGPIGEKIRRVLEGQRRMSPAELQSFFFQDRQNHLEDLIVPALEDGQTVISDRYFLSSCAFGGIELDIKWILALNDGIILPDITFLLDVPPEVCLERIDKRGTPREFFETTEKLSKVRENYLRLAHDDTTGQRVSVINGEGLVGEVAEEVLNIFSNTN